MDLSFSPEDMAFQAEVRAWIAENFDDDMRARMAQSKNHNLDKATQVKWQKRLAARGWLAVNWPVEYGGPGFTASQKYVFDMEMSAAGVPHSIPFGLTMVAPVIMAFGSEAQKKQHLPPILASDLWWCQGYSEPGSGSDLASLQLKADRDGDHYVLNGSKIWTTLAQRADWIFCLVRTSSEGKPQSGISFLLVDMKTPGIQVQALPTLDGPAEGEQEINQVFFDNVRVPVSNLVGEENKGWTYAKYLLEFERGNPYAAGLRHQLNKVRRIAAKERADGQTALESDPDFRRKLAEMEIKIEAINATEMRIFAAMGAGQPVGPASSMLKCEGSAAQQAVTELALEAVGIYGQPFMRDTWAELNGQNDAVRAGPDYAAPTAPMYFNFRKTSIYAGSNEIQRNIMAKLILGL
jgi:alkylation response protein AidB-like acyl-CoA dehydrogenase